MEKNSVMGRKSRSQFRSRSRYVSGKMQGSKSIRRVNVIPKYAGVNMGELVKNLVKEQLKESA